MKKLEKRDYKNIGILLSFILLYILVLLLNGRIFGSEVDWTNQHIVYPEYFRSLFYNTGQLIPSFALNIGMGQNIFYFSYYGLLSPIILISYLLPFIPMYIYMPLASIVSLMASVYLFYKWINDKYDSKIALIVTAIFMLNSTFIYHFHRHLMFVIYMPFLLGALKSVDLYFKNKKILPLIIYSVCLILTNYYFGAYGIITIGIYTIYKLLTNKKFEVKKLSKVIYLEIIAILISCILLLPTIYALLNGRIPTTVEAQVNLLSLFSPKTNFDYTFYSSYYSWGLTFIYIVAIIFGFISKKKNRIFLSGMLSLIILFPIFSYVLNGFMYFDGKCYLPLLPLALLIVSEFVKEFVEEKIELKQYLKYIIICGILLLVLAFNSYCFFLLLADIILITIFLSKQKKFKNKYLLFIPVIFISFLSFVFSATNEAYIKLSEHFKLNNEAYYELSNIKDNLYRLSVEDKKLFTVNKIYDNSLRTSIYSSLSNKNYFNLFRNVFQNEILNRDNYVMSQTSNILFNIYTGTKYVITSNDEPIGYNRIKTVDGISLYENSDVLPFAYLSNNLMSKREFETLKYPENIDALLNYVIIDDELDDVYNSKVSKIDLDYEILESKNVEYDNNNGHYIVNAHKDNKISLKINNDLNNKILIIKFNMNKVKDGFACSSAVTINNITNALSCKNWKYNNQNKTFEYVISSNTSIENLEIKFTTDKFDISDILVYAVDYNDIKDISKNVIPINFKQEKDNIFTSSIDSDGGIVKTTIPYEEKGFELLIDGKKQEIIKVDNTFVGFKLSEGKHEVILKYTSPLLKEGIIISLFGIFILTLTIVFSKKNKKI